MCGCVVLVNRLIRCRNETVGPWLKLCRSSWSNGIRAALTFGAENLARLLDCPKEDLLAEINHFFKNTWEWHGSDAPLLSSLCSLSSSCSHFQMCACKTLGGASMFSARPSLGSRRWTSRTFPMLPGFRSLTFPFLGLGLRGNNSISMRNLTSSSAAAVAAAVGDDSSDDSVEELLTKGDGIGRLMKMERTSEPEKGGGRWFPYLDLYRVGSASLVSGEVIDVLGPYIMDARKERIKKTVENRSYSVSLVVEGLTDFGNVSAAFRSADALGVHSVHVVSSDSRKRYRDNRHVSKGAEKWLDIELWNSPKECFHALKKRGYRIVATHLGIESFSVYELDWTVPTAIVVGNEHMGISDEALQLSDLHCSIPMRGMVDSFNVSVAAGILMHHAVCDRVSRCGYHGDLTSEERQILTAEFFLRHKASTMSIVHEYVNRTFGNTVA
ncbi:hypothetical protein AXF42_Ash021225 [Apostasia shenzhenica]|uniref:tRNA/rRNA methyltransferase SpoU type domain-containing protein n=1 Tax=Apostasia shenzhenica TaxID=1088818 RepID=A0A2I0A579_9ASPA|nr:hypothetical protein AXF42_Ash021225 [Apostasia shenzhenica]